MFRTCPVVTVPSGIAENGVPTGLQVVGRTFDDPTVMRIAAAVEDGIGGLSMAS
jgi:Asp-tRNA(Asn)/Glu-tRNA(Gln) amidotransferase A subunit family amidase